MTKTFKTSDTIIFNNPEIDFVTTLIKFNTAPTINNANTQYLTRNSGTGNLERVTILPTLYNTNGSITGTRIVSATGGNNLTFNNPDISSTLTLATWNIVNIGGFTVNITGPSINVTGSGSVTVSAAGATTLNANVQLDLGTGITPTTNLSALNKTLNINSNNTKLNNIPLQLAGGISDGEYLFIDKTTKIVRGENIPTAYGTFQIQSVNSGPTLTSVSPIDVSGADVIIGAGGSTFLFITTVNDGVQYDTSGAANIMSTFVKTFKIEYSGYFIGSVAQEYSAGILINGVLQTLSVNQFTYSGTTNLPFSVKPFTVTLTNGNEIRLALGRNTSDATILFNGNLVITPISYY